MYVGFTYTSAIIVSLICAYYKMYQIRPYRIKFLRLIFSTGAALTNNTECHDMISLDCYYEVVVTGYMVVITILVPLTAVCFVAVDFIYKQE